MNADKTADAVVSQPRIYRLRRLWIVLVWVVGLLAVERALFRCDGVSGISLPAVASLFGALGYGGSVTIVLLGLEKVLPGREHAARAGDLAGSLGRRLRYEGGIPLWRALVIGAALLLATWWGALHGYEQGLTRMASEACMATASTGPSSSVARQAGSRFA